MVDRNSCSNAFGLPLSPKKKHPLFNPSVSLLPSHCPCVALTAVTIIHVLSFKWVSVLPDCSASLRSVANCPCVAVTVYKRRPYVLSSGMLPGWVRPPLTSTWAINHIEGCLCVPVAIPLRFINNSVSLIWTCFLSKRASTHRVSTCLRVSLRLYKMSFYMSSSQYIVII